MKPICRPPARLHNLSSAAYRFDELRKSDSDADLAVIGVSKRLLAGQRPNVRVASIMIAIAVVTGTNEQDPRPSEWIGCFGIVNETTRFRMASQGSVKDGADYVSPVTRAARWVTTDLPSGTSYNGEGSYSSITTTPGDRGRLSQ